MSGERRRPSAVEVSVVAVGLGVLVLASPLRRLWAQAALGPAAGFVVWIAIVVIGAALLRAAGAPRE